MATYESVLDFWFKKWNIDPDLQPDSRWFSLDPAFDKAISERFQVLHGKASVGEFDSWMEQGYSCLSLAMLMDQLPRCMFRGQARAYATASHGLMAALHGIEMDFDQDVQPVMRQFFYYPLSHSENADHQAQAVQCFSQFEGDPVLGQSYTLALRQQEIIQRFGRFPDRNPILGRPSTPEELAFLQANGN
jgi:uncharacterized protein (DUF924 family)